VSAVGMCVWVPTTAETRPSTVPAHGDFFTGHFGRENRGISPLPRVDRRQNLVRLTEGAVGGGHIRAALQVDHRAGHAVMGWIR